MEKRQDHQREPFSAGPASASSRQLGRALRPGRSARPSAQRATATPAPQHPGSASRAWHLLTSHGAAEPPLSSRSDPRRRSVPQLPRLSEELGEGELGGP